MKTKIKLLMFLLFLGTFSSVIANNPTLPATNTNCNSAISGCDLVAGHTFDNNNGVAVVCGTNYVYQYYYFYTTGGSFSFDLNITSPAVMSGYELVGVMPTNLPDACEQLTSNASTILSGSITPSASYTPTASGNLPAGMYMLVVKMDMCYGGTITVTSKKGNFSCAPEVPCENCVASFELTPGKKYIFSAWTKEEDAAPEKTSYDFPSVDLVFSDGLTQLSTFTFSPTGVIIDGWQRMEGEFIVPTNTDNMQITLKVSNGDAYFDDIRIFPFDGSMKSYVYDPVSLRLMAELDERNYATIYEYDEEGKLIRVKKETERGVMTIQENKTFIKKD